MNETVSSKFFRLCCKGVLIFIKSDLYSKIENREVISMADQISILRQMFKSLSTDEQRQFLESLNHKTADVNASGSLKSIILKNHPNTKS